MPVDTVRPFDGVNRPGEMGEMVKQTSYPYVVTFRLWVCGVCIYILVLEIEETKQKKEE